LGIVVLANQNASPLIHLVPDVVADLVINLPMRDKNSMMIARRKKRESTQLKPARINVDSITTKPLFSPTKYAGRFENAGYGEVKVEVYKNALLLTYFDLNLLLIPKGGHRFSSHYWEKGEISPNGVGDVIFGFDNNGVLRSFQIPFEPTVHDIVFRKK